MRFVLDTSVAMAWCFEEEATPYTRRILDLLGRGEGVVASLWPFEVANVLAVAIRHRRLKAAQTAEFLTLVSVLPIHVEAVSAGHIFEKVFPLAREQGLSCYDAAYLELALRLGLPLATLDKALRRAAARVGAPLVSEI